VADVHGRALGRELEVGALVVDGEGLHGEVHLDAGLFLELREIVPEIFIVGRLEAGGVDGHAVVGLAAALGMDGGSSQRREGRTKCAGQDRTTTKRDHLRFLPEAGAPAVSPWRIDMSDISSGDFVFMSMPPITTTTTT